MFRDKPVVFKVIILKLERKIKDAICINIHKCNLNPMTGFLRREIHTDQSNEAS